MNREEVAGAPPVQPEATAETPVAAMMMDPRDVECFFGEMNRIVPITEYVGYVYLNPAPGSDLGEKQVVDMKLDQAACGWPSLAQPTPIHCGGECRGAVRSCGRQGAPQAARPFPFRKSIMMYWPSVIVEVK